MVRGSSALHAASSLTALITQVLSTSLGPCCPAGAAPLSQSTTKKLPAVSSLLLFIKKVFLGGPPLGTWDFSSLTWDRTCTPALKAWSLNRWTAREDPSLLLELNSSEQCKDHRLLETVASYELRTS